MNVITEPESFFGKIKYNLLPPAVKTEVVSLSEGDDFLRLTVPIVRGKIYWNNVRAAAGESCRVVLAQKGVPVAESVHFKTFESERFLSLLALNSFLKLLRMFPRHHYLQECCVVDLSAAFAERLQDLPRYCRTIKVITATPERYEAFRLHCLREYGCAVCISDNLSKAFSSPVVLLSKTPTHASAFSNTSLVFAGSAKNVYTSRLLTPEGVSLPAKYLSMLPAGINPTAFAAALYELSGVSSLSKCVCPSFRQNNLIYSYKEVVEMLDKF